MATVNIEHQIGMAIAEQFGVPAGTVTTLTHFENDLEADSMDRVELALTLEDEFDISIPDEDLDKLETVGDLVLCVRSILNKEGQ